MPIYEYICRDCGHALEQLQKMTDDALVQCPACDRPTLKRKVSAVGFRLAGGGWYETDFKSDKRRNVAGGEDKTEAKAENGGDKSDGGESKAADGAAKKKDAGGGENKTPAKKDGGSDQAASKSSTRPSSSPE